jgi:hypothetical protein
VAAAFDPTMAERVLRAKLDSLDNDTRRCFAPMADVPPAPFPAVLYGLATVDYFSSCWRGWNESQNDPAKKQTERIADFLEQVCGYGRMESQIAVAMWRHKAMHTGEPRLLRNRDTGEVYLWEIDASGVAHMTLTSLGGTPAAYRFQMNPFTLAADLGKAVFGTGGYWDQLVGSADQQAKFLAFMQETESYTIRIKP